MRTNTLLAPAVAALVIAVAAACGGNGASAPPAEPPPPVDTGGTPSSGALAPGGGLTIEEALDSTLGGPLAVRGFVVAVDGEPVLLCSALAESYPPQCGGPSLVVEGLDLSTVEGLTRAEEPEYAHTAWTDAEVSLVGPVEDGVLTVDPTVQA